MSWYDTKQSDHETPVMLELCGMQSTPSLLWPGVVAPDMILSMGQIELFDIETECLYQIELFEIELFDHLTVCKKVTDV